MLRLNQFISLVFVFCAALSAAQNAWIESSSDQSQDPCYPSDTIRVRIFDPYGYDAFDSIEVSHCANHIFYVDSGPLFFDTTLVCNYPSCGAEIKEVWINGFQMQGNNVDMQKPYYAFSQLTDFTDWKAEWYHDSPRFDLQYELVRCNDQPFFVNIFKEERNGDSLRFQLYDHEGSIPIPDGVSMDLRTGEVSWVGSPDTGLYHFMAYIVEYRFEKNVTLGEHVPRFSIRVTDSCESFIANDHLGNENLFHVSGREFTLNEGETWNRTFRVALEDWDSISVIPSSEMFLHHDIFDVEWSAKTVGDSVEVTIIWNIGNIFGRNHPYLVTYHVSAWKNGKKHDRVLTNAVYVKKVLGVKTPQIDKEISVSPNPFYNELRIKHNEPITVSVYDIQGRQVVGRHVYTDPLQLQHLTSGTYVLKVESKTNVFKTLIVKR